MNKYACTQKWTPRRHGSVNVEPQCNVDGSFLFSVSERENIWSCELYFIYSRRPWKSGNTRALVRFPHGLTSPPPLRWTIIWLKWTAISIFVQFTLLVSPMVEDKTVTWKFKAHYKYKFAFLRNHGALGKGRRRWQRFWGWIYLIVKQICP